MSRLIRQCTWIPTPPITEQNCPDQHGRVHIVTGGYAGVGLELCKILYSANGTVYVAGRSAEKAKTAIAAITENAPASKGKVDFLQFDLSDLKTIKPAVEKFNKKESRLDTLTNNAGVMVPPKGMRDAQGEDIQIGTNLVGPFLLTKLLYPLLKKTAASSPAGTVRVSWAGSMALDVGSFKPGGVDIDAAGKPIEKDIHTNYGMTKAGNLWLANEYAKRYDDGIVQTCFNPGNLNSELQRHLTPWQAAIISRICYTPNYGAYTELYCAVGPVEAQKKATYIVPWGRECNFRSDIEHAMRSQNEGGSGKAEKFWQWIDKYTDAYA
jgi:retinol dehydrogenase-12